MNEKELTSKLLEIFPGITIHVTESKNNLKVHFKAEEHNFVPSKWMLGNALGIPGDKIKVDFMKFDVGVWEGPGVLFTLKDACSMNLNDMGV